ncbi:DUF2269 family protein [Paenibacillus sp. FSL M7-1455]|uniref:DUF2269 family protein n=1 Tax=Paenibacillus sp. FSL M7-1455 TaxID=2975316 RepID=UPI0030F594E7
MNLWLTLHLLGVVLFAGNIITAAFWKVRADLTKNPAAIHHAVQNVMLADYIFTIPGLFLVILSGSIMAARAGFSLEGFNWLTLSLALFALTGLLWAAILIPLQRKMIRTSAGSIEKGEISQAYRKASRSWAVFGIAATLLPIVILYLMVMKGF